MTDIFRKILLAIALSSLMSCGIYKNFQEERKPEIRIVDAQGRPHSVKMRTPEYNINALASQGNISENQINKLPNKQPEEQISQNKYTDNQANAPSEQLEQTLQMQTAPSESGEKEAIGIAEDNMVAEEEVEYDLGDNSKAIKDTKKNTEVLTEEIEEKPAIEQPKGIFVQAGSFTQKSHAKGQLNKVRKKAGKNAKLTIAEAQINQQTYYRVLIGPFATKKKAEIMVKNLAKKGHKSIIIRNK